jgi:NAD+ kinase
MAVTCVGLVVHTGRSAARDAAARVHEWCARRGLPCTDVDVWSGDLERRGARAEAEAAGNPDLVVTFGGDGTFLRGARIAAQCDADVLGVDIGRVGFLTEATVDGVIPVLDAVCQGRARIEERILLSMRASRTPELPAEFEALLRYGRGPVLPPPQARPDVDEAPGWGVALDVLALNDIVVEKLSRDRQAGIGVYLAGRLLASYSADAVIVSTPTGSTAYSFAAGGPVLSPRLDAMVFTPVAAHMSFDRSVVTAPDEPVALRILPHSGRVVITADGQPRGVLDPGDWIGVIPATRRLRLVRMGPTDFYSRLRERFRLTDAPATAEDESAPVFRPNTPAPPDVPPLDLPPLPAPPPGTDGPR